MKTTKIKLKDLKGRVFFKLLSNRHMSISETDHQEIAIKMNKFLVKMMKIRDNNYHPEFMSKLVFYFIAPKDRKKVEKLIKSTQKSLAHISSFRMECTWFEFD